MSTEPCSWSGLAKSPRLRDLGQSRIRILIERLSIYRGKLLPNFQFELSGRREDVGGFKTTHTVTKRSVCEALILNIRYGQRVTDERVPM